MVELQHQSGIDTVLDPFAFIKIYSSLLPHHLFQSCSGYPPPPGHNSYHLPIFNPLTPLHSIFAPTSPPQLAQARSDHPTGRRPHPTVSTTHLGLPPFLGGHKEFLMRSCNCHPSSSFPPFSVLNLRPGSCQPQELSLPRVPSSLYLPPFPARLPPSPLWLWPADQSPAVPEGFESCSSTPRTFCIYLDLPVFRAVSYCLLGFNLPKCWLKG